MGPRSGASFPETTPRDIWLNASNARATLRSARAPEPLPFGYPVPAAATEKNTSNVTPPPDYNDAWTLATALYTAFSSIVYGPDVYGLVEGEIWVLQNNTGEPIFKGRVAYETLAEGRAKLESMSELPPKPDPGFEVRPWSLVSGEGAIGGLPPGITDEAAEAQTEAILGLSPGISSGGSGL